MKHFNLIILIFTASVFSTEFVLGNEYSSKKNVPAILIKDAVFTSNQKVCEKLPKSENACPIRNLTIDMTYVSDEPLTLAFTPENCAFETYCIKTFPASKEQTTIRTKICFYELRNPSVPTLMILRSSGKFDIRTFTITEHGNGLPDTMIPRTLRKNHLSHKRIMTDTANAPQNYILLFGDSLTENWCRGKRFDYMKTHFPIVNAGICGDKVEDVLFRMNEMSKMLKENPPSVVTFLIGTNNIGLGSKATDIAEGIHHLVWQIHQYCPNAKIIVFGIPARGLSWNKRLLSYPDAVNRILLSTASPEGAPSSEEKITDT